MINIVHDNTHYDDKRVITAIEVKLKDFGENGGLFGQSLVTTISIAFFKTTLLTDVGKSVKISINPKRNNIVNLYISLDKENDLTRDDVARFLNALQAAIDETILS